MKKTSDVSAVGSVAGGGTVRSSVRSSLFVLSLVLALGASAPLAFAATTVTPNNMNNWYFYNDNGDTQLTADANHGFVTGPATPLIGVGSVHLTKTTTEKYGIATGQFASTSLSSITALSYSTYRASGTSALAPSLGFDVDSNSNDGITAYEGRLTYEPYYTQTVKTGEWQTWDTMAAAAGSSASTGNWWFSRATLNGGVPSVCTMNNPCTWAEVLAAYPNVAIRSGGYNFIIRTNGADGDAFDGNVDNLIFNSTTYDFDPATSATVNAIDPTCAGQIPCYSTLQDAINAVAFGGTVELQSDVRTTSEVTVNRAITINGNGHVLLAPIVNTTNDNANNAGLGIIEVGSGTVTVNNLTVDGTGSTKIHGINIFDAENVILDGVTVKNASKAGITVNGTNVTVNNITTSGNLWGGINADLMADVTIQATVLTVTGTSHHSGNGAAIWIDDTTKTVSVTDTDKQYSYVNSGNARSYNLKSLVNPTIDLGTPVSGAETTAATTTITNGTVDVVIPTGTVITSTDTNWNGTINLPTVVTTTVAPTDDPGHNTNVVGSIEVGVSGVHLTFSNAVRLAFVGQGTNLIGWSQGEVFHAITNVCAADNQATGDALAPDTECRTVSDGNLVVWTKHFTTFTTYTQPAKSVAASSHSIGGGPGCAAGTAYNPSTGSCTPVGATPATPAVPGVSPAVPATPSINSNGNANGRVLGASTFNFTRDLGVGLSGADVTALQQILIDAGILKISAPTGNFGQLTKAAVQAFQKLHGIAQVGNVGPLTRGELNKGVTPTAESAGKTNLSASQADAIISIIESFGADASVVAKVRASLGR